MALSLEETDKLIERKYGIFSSAVICTFRKQGDFPYWQVYKGRKGLKKQLEDTGNELFQESNLLSKKLNIRYITAKVYCLGFSS